MFKTPFVRTRSHAIMFQIFGRFRLIASLEACGFPCKAKYSRFDLAALQMFCAPFVNPDNVITKVIILSIMEFYEAC